LVSELILHIRLTKTGKPEVQTLFTFNNVGGQALRPDLFFKSVDLGVHEEKIRNINIPMKSFAQFWIN